MEQLVSSGHSTSCKTEIYATFRSHGNEAAEAFGVEGPVRDLATMQAGMRMNTEQASKRALRSSGRRNRGGGDRTGQEGSAGTRSDVAGHPRGGGRLIPLQSIQPVWDERFPAEQARIVQLLVERVTVSPTGLRIDMKTAGMRELIQSVMPERKAA
jgi:hypothetical protein